MKGKGFFIISLLIIPVVTGCNFFNIGQNLLSTLGVNAYLDETLKVDGSIYFIAEHGDYVYTVGIADDTQVVHKIQKEPLQMVSTYPITGPQIGEMNDKDIDDHYWHGDQPRYYGFEDSNGIFFICDRHEGRRIWLNEDAGTAQYLTSGNYGTRFVFFSHEGTDYRIDYEQYNGQLRIVNISTALELQILSIPTDKIIENIEFISGSDGDFILLCIKNAEYGEQDDSVREIRPEIIKLSAASIGTWDLEYPYGGDNYYLDVEGEYRWTDNFQDPDGSNLIAPDFYFFSGNSDFYLCHFEGAWNQWYCYDSTGNFLQTLFLNDQYRAVLSRTDNYLYAAFNKKLLKYRLAE